MQHALDRVLLNERVAYICMLKTHKAVFVPDCHVTIGSNTHRFTYDSGFLSTEII